MDQSLSDGVLQLSEEQRDVYESIEFSNNNFFVTGKAGTGKSVLL